MASVAPVSRMPPAPRTAPAVETGFAATTSFARTAPAIVEPATAGPGKPTAAVTDIAIRRHLAATSSVSVASAAGTAAKTVSPRIDVEHLGLPAQVLENVSGN